MTNKKNKILVKDNGLISLVDNHIITKLVRRIHEAEIKKKKFWKNKKDEFYFDFLTYEREIEKKIKDLQLCIKFISTYTASRTVKKDISRSEYITYHLEQYYINIVALYDRILHLVNFIYDLGLSDRYITKDILCTNNNLDKDVAKFLKKIDKEIREIRSLQNKIKHKEGLKEFHNNESFKKAELFEMATRIDPKNKKNKTFMNFAKDWYSIYLKEKKKELEKNNKNLIKIINVLYNKLLPQINKRVKVFK